MAPTKTVTFLSTAEAAKKIGVSKSTLLRWIVSGVVTDVEKDRKGWRRFYPADIERFREFNDGKEPSRQQAIV